MEEFSHFIKVLDGYVWGPVMMALITSANKKGIRFEPEEISLIMEILKDGKSREEQEQIDRMMQMVNSYLRR